MSVDTETIGRLKKSKAPQLSWSSFGHLGYIPKKAKQEFLDAHKDDMIIEEKDGRYTMSLIAIPLRVEDIIQQSREDANPKQETGRTAEAERRTEG